MLDFFGSCLFLCVLFFFVSLLFRELNGVEEKPISDNNSPQIKYDVFVSFRGKDIRRGFLSHLTEAFQTSKINAFVDDKNLKTGEEIKPSLVAAIEGSSISLIIFSQNYASSRWCLEELETILECKEKYGRSVIPVFYYVEPTDVRHQSLESYKNAFAKHENRHKTKVQLWRRAMNKSADLSGIHSSKFSGDAELVKEIVDLVLNRLVKPLVNSKRLVGIDEKIATLESLIRKEPKHARLIGIWGMGGIGKTTLAEEVFNKLQPKYEGSYFLANERDQSSKHELISLKEKMYSKLLGYDVKIDTPNSLPEDIARRIGRKKVFIVLDDVHDSEHLENLLGITVDNFGSGSRVIVTTRDEQVLRANKADEIYRLEEFNFNKALELFNLSAFNQSDHRREYNELSKRVVNYAQGIPLVVKVLAGLLHGKNKEEWESMLDKLKIMPPTKVYEVMKLSYNGLDRKGQQIFLDLACFFLRTHERVNVGDLKSLLKDNESDNSVVFELGRLKDKALITISDDNIISIHDSLQEMAWEIARQESIEDLGSRSRLWDLNDIYEVLKNDKVNDTIRSLQIKLTKESIEDPRSGGWSWDLNDIYEPLKNDKVNDYIKEQKLMLRIFAKMSRLKFLEIIIIDYYVLRKIMKDNYDCHDQLILDEGNLDEGPQFLATELRFLSWYHYPLKSLPENISAEKLVILKLKYGRMEKLWDGVKNLVNLKEVDLTHCENLKELPDFSKARNLEVLILEWCRMLTSVHPSIFSLPKLDKLDLRWCTSLTILASVSHLCSLSYLKLAFCENLREFSVISENMKELSLGGTKVKALPSSFEHQSKLKSLHLSGSEIERLPSSINNLTSLLHLHIGWCGNLQTIPELPMFLESLDIKKCKSLQTLPVLPMSLKTLDASECTSLNTLLSFPSTADEQLKENRKLVLFWNCLNLDEHTLVAIGLNVQINVMKFANHLLSTPNHNHAQNYKDYDRNHHPYRAVYAYPGSSVPEWLEYKTTKDDYIIIDLSSAPPSPLLGFIFCFVLGNYESTYWGTLKVDITISDGDAEDEGKRESVRMYQDSWAWTIESDHVCVVCDQRCSDVLNSRAKNQTSFKIHVTMGIISIDGTFDALPQGVLKGFGVSPISSSTYNSFIQQLELHDSDSIFQFH